MSVTIGSSRMPLLGMSLSPCCRFQTGEAPARNHWSKVDRITGPGDSQSVMRVNAKWPRKQMIPRYPAEIKMPHRSDFGTPCCLRPSFAGSAGSTGKIDRVQRAERILHFKPKYSDLETNRWRDAEFGVTGPAAAAWLRTAARAAARTPKTDLVWSGPEVPGLHARDTNLGAYMKSFSVVANARSGQAHMPSSTDRRLLRCLLDEWRRDQVYASRCC